MVRRPPFGFLILGFLWFALLAPGGVRAAGLNLPQEIKTFLDLRYPGWQWGRVSKEVEDYFHAQRLPFRPNLITGDFDGNGRPDYAVKIIAGGSWQFIVFLEHEGHFQGRVLASGSGPGLDVYLTLYRKGDRGYDFERNKRFTFARDAAEVNYFGKAAVAYVYEQGKFKEIYSAD